MRLGCRWDLQKLTDALRAEPCGTGGRGTPHGRRQTHWSWTGPAKQIEVDARIAKNGAKVVIHLPSLLVAPAFHGDCSLRNHHFLQATIVHVGANTLERTGTTSTSRMPPVRISRHPLIEEETYCIQRTARVGELDSPLQHRRSTGSGRREHDGGCETHWLAGRSRNIKIDAYIAERGPNLIVAAWLDRQRRARDGQLFLVTMSA